ncbi:hypothetical protein [Desulfosporosinus sp. Sb-LF]|uniref:hypothetical protein n=1 Tax=Desulfosporosinus sp. Sb-LF TaxID=2560027 RepID=UPI00107F7CA7|nr:hypothetical protein [Desulfosporosinus sp. Sb-LF]TGE34590.1 hypothetical protein E4K68_02675 [Desulfosporosinus sp. Sb-LF]
MNSRPKRWLNVVYSGLVGFNFGFVVALLLAQWTWLELRFNTGLAILVGAVIGLGIGFFREVKHPLAVTGISLMAALIPALIITDAELPSLLILTGYTIREGLLMPDLSMQVANIAFSLTILCTILVSFFLNRNRALRPRENQY